MAQVHVIQFKAQDVFRKKAQADTSGLTLKAQNPS